ncbi:Hypothetical protein ZOSMA_111G00190 [Zostera marina]|uniref:Uncharacterized protein n=1 Tax=Zostera marina TaxID=29655 RepID=A0A0K9Q335_ZOSMR|nr:Hypothetical protein ZOSMA_111G00190 [Zostera marina]
MLTEFLDSLHNDTLNGSPPSNYFTTLMTGSLVVLPKSIGGVDPSCFQISALQHVGKKRSSPSYGAPVVDSVVTTPFPIPTVTEMMPVPLFFCSPVTVARWNAASEFVREFGSHNPEWKVLQSVLCTFWLEGAIISSMNTVIKVALAQINFLVFECAGYRAENVRLKDKCESLEAKLEATVKYCDELSHKLKEKIDAGELD